jgi:hypothetical protein
MEPKVVPVLCIASVLSAPGVTGASFAPKTLWMGYRNTWIEYPVLAAVQGWLDDPTTAHGFAVYSTTLDTGRDGKFATTQYGASYAPQLVLELNRGPGCP